MSNQWTQQTAEGREWKRTYDREKYPEQRAVRLARSLKRRNDKRAWLLVDSARQRAKLRRLPFDLDGYQGELQKRIDAGVCEFSGVPLRLDGGRTFDSPSLDRINPTLGYTRGNVRIVCDLINRALNNYGEDALLVVIDSLRKRRSLLKPISE